MPNTVASIADELDAKILEIGNLFAGGEVPSNELLSKTQDMNLLTKEIRTLDAPPNITANYPPTSQPKNGGETHTES